MRGVAGRGLGGLGVFAAAMRVALWGLDAEELAAGLLICRLWYYLMPCMLALAVRGVRECRLHFRGRHDVGDR